MTNDVSYSLPKFALGPPPKPCQWYGLSMRIKDPQETLTSEWPHPLAHV